MWTGSSLGAPPALASNFSISTTPTSHYTVCDAAVDSVTPCVATVPQGFATNSALVGCLFYPADALVAAVLCPTAAPPLLPSWASLDNLPNRIPPLYRLWMPPVAEVPEGAYKVLHPPLFPLPPLLESKNRVATLPMVVEWR